MLAVNILSVKIKKRAESWSTVRPTNSKQQQQELDIVEHRLDKFPTPSHSVHPCSWTFKLVPAAGCCQCWPCHLLLMNHSCVCTDSDWVIFLAAEVDFSNERKTNEESQAAASLIAANIPFPPGLFGFQVTVSSLSHLVPVYRRCSSPFKHLITHFLILFQPSC